MEKEEIEFAEYYHRNIRPELMNVIDAEVVSGKVTKDYIVKSVVDKFISRSETGIKKYGTTMDRDDLSFMDWISHLQEELMDAVIYCEKIKKYETTVTTTENTKGN